MDVDRAGRHRQPSASVRLNRQTAARHQLAIGVHSERAIAGVAGRAIRQGYLKEAIPLKGRVERIAGRLQRARHELVRNIRELRALADADQVDIQAAGTDRRRQSSLIANVGGVRDSALETGRVGIRQVVGDDVQLPLAGQHARDGDALRHFHRVRPCPLR